MPNRHRTGARWGVPLASVAVVLVLAASPAAGQILPPIYRPLPLEEGDRFRVAADSLRRAAADATGRAETLEDGSRTLRQSGVGVAEKLLAEAQRLTDQISRLETQLRVDALAIDALQAQRNDFLQRARGYDSVVFEARAALEAMRVALPPEFDTRAPVDPALEAQLRADSVLASTYREHAEALSAQAAQLAAQIGGARQRIIALQQQEQQLREYAAEIASGRTAGELTADRLDLEARDLRRTAERLTQEAREQTELAEELRVQSRRVVLPVRNRVEAMRFYGEDGRAVLGSLVLSLGEGGRSGSINTEIVSDYAGPLRFGVGFVVAEAQEEPDTTTTAEAPRTSGATALERFYAGGGNFVIYSALPLAFNRSPYHSLTLQMLGKIGFDVPGARRAVAVSRIPTNLDLGFEGYGTFNTYGGRIKAFGLVRSALAIGNDPFYENIGRSSGALPYTQFTAGAEIGSAAKVLISGAYAPEGLGRELSLTFQVGR